MHEPSAGVVAPADPATADVVGNTSVTNAVYGSSVLRPWHKESQPERGLNARGVRMRRSSVLLAVVLCVCGPLLALAAPSAVSPQEIKATFATGKPFTSKSPSGTVFVLILKSDGTALRTPKGVTAGTSGTWHLSATGYCSKWGANSENCFTLQKNGAEYLVLDAKGKIAAHWSAPS